MNQRLPVVDLSPTQRLSVRSHQNVNERAPAANHLHFIRRIISFVDCLRARDTLFTLTFWLAAQFHRSMDYIRVM
jgi:hypothetical protein